MIFQTTELFCFIVVLSAVSFLVDATAIARQRIRREDEQNADFDYLVLSVKWGPEHCQSLKDACIRNKVERKWYLNGLWPTLYEYSSKPTFCSNDAFNYNLLEGETLNGLQTYWPSLSKRNTDESNWSYEWMKHGTCAVAGYPDVFQSQSYYFSHALNVFQEYDFKSILANYGIYPGDKTTTLSSLKGAFQSRFGISGAVIFDCTNSGDRQMVTSAHVCLSKQYLTVESCPETQVDKCNSYKEIHYSSGAFTAYKIGSFILIQVLCLILFSLFY